VTPVLAADVYVTVDSCTILIILITLYFNSTHAHLPQNWLHWYSFVYNPSNDGLAEAATCMRETINGK